MVSINKTLPAMSALFLACMVTLSGISCAEAPIEKAEKKDNGSIISEKKQSNPEKVIVYYLHTTYRCWSCTQFELLTKEVLEENFAEEIKKGTLEYRVINIEEDANKHFVEEYKLVTKSLILSLQGSEKEIEWKNLDQIWQLVQKSEKFKTYVKESIDGYLGKI